MTATLNIVGAGPAGCISAISAIRNRSSEATIFEKEKIGKRNKSCSGLFSLDGLDSLKEFIDYKKTEINEIYGADIYLSGEKISVRTKKPVAVVCNRKEFDELLIDNAEKEGAKIKFGERISNLNHKNIIGADGAGSNTATNFSFPKIRRFVSTLKTKAKHRASDKRIVEVFLSNSVFPGFFGWVIPHNEEECEIGCGVELPCNPRVSFEWLIKMKKTISLEERSGAIIPISVRPRTSKRIGGKNVILVGDAAGQVKATTGGGVIFGGNCAKIAGKYYDDPLKYELNWRKSFGIDLHAHSIARDYLTKKSDEQLRMLAIKLRKSGVEDYLSEHGHMDKPSKMINIKLMKIACAVLPF